MQAGVHHQFLRFGQRDVERLQNALVLYPLAVHGRVTAGKFPVRTGREILDRLDAILGQGNQHLRSKALEIDQALFDAKFFGLRQRLGVYLVQRLAGAGLKFLGRVLIEPVDRQKFVDIDIGNLFQRCKSLGHQQLSHDLVHVHGVHEQFRAFLEFGLTAFGLIGLRHDVDVQSGQLRGQAHVLAAPPDGQRQLLVRDDNGYPVGILVQNDLGDLGGLKRVDQEGRRVFVPRNDVDFLALQLVDDSLNAASAHTDASSDRVDRAVIGNNADLGARSGIAGNGLDLDDAVIDLGHFHFEQSGQEFRRGARQEYLRATGLGADFLDIGADAVAVAEHLAVDQLVAAQNGLAPAHVDDDVAVFGPLDQTVDDLALTVLEFFVLTLAFRFADFLQDDLFRGLRRDPAEIHRR